MEWPVALAANGHATGEKHLSAAFDALNFDLNEYWLEGPLLMCYTENSLTDSEALANSRKQAASGAKPSPGAQPGQPSPRRFEAPADARKHQPSDIHSTC